jgi:hypothetical protein
VNGPPAPAAPASGDELSGAFARIEAERAEARARVERQGLEAAEAVRNRRFITTIVMYTWAASLLAFAAISIAAALYPTLAHVTTTASDLIKVAVMPLATFVLGYYLSKG